MANARTRVKRKADQNQPLASIAQQQTASTQTLWAPIYCATHHWQNLETGKHCSCPPGPQWLAALAPEREILYGGARGAGKSDLGRGWAMKGNPSDPIDHPNGEHVFIERFGEKFCPYCVNTSYIYHPRYRLLVVRWNEEDLEDWADRAKSLYKPFGADFVAKDSCFQFPSGAKIVLSHLKNIAKFQGPEFQRLLTEELTHVPDEIRYLKLNMSIRSTFTCFQGCVPGKCLCGKLVPQTLNTTNPGGPGHAWTKKRFVSIAPRKTSYVDPISKLTRIFIPALVEDNPYLMADPNYLAMLESLPEPDRSMWRFGDWDQLAGMYWREWRPVPFPSEPPEACHVVSAPHPHLPLWWPRAIGMDWGYDHNSVILWGCQNLLDQRLHVYREYKARRTTAMELGIVLAEQTADELIHSEQSFQVHLSHDAFYEKDGRRTLAQQIQDGIEAVLGRNAVFIAEYTPEEKEIEERFGAAAAATKLAERMERQASAARISLVSASKRRVDGWSYMRNMLKFRVDMKQYPLDEAWVKRIAEDPLDGQRKLLELQERQRRVEDPIRPKLKIWDCCNQTIEEFGAAVYKDGTEDLLEDDDHWMDALNALRYLVMGIAVTATRAPFQQLYAERIEQIKRERPWILDDSMMMAQVWKKARNDFNKTDVPVTHLRLGRAARPVRRHVM